MTSRKKTAKNLSPYQKRVMKAVRKFEDRDQNVKGFREFHVHGWWPFATKPTIFVLFHSEHPVKRQTLRFRVATAGVFLDFLDGLGLKYTIDTSYTPDNVRFPPDGEVVHVFSVKVLVPKGGNK